jgi:arabinose-5-phosphate isomerase
MSPHRPDAHVNPNQAAEAAMALLGATAAALEALAGSWDLAQVRDWTHHTLARSGRVVLTGMGKSGLVAQKISATLASTGCPSFYLHPAEALHGDLGMVTQEDSLLILSNSGETEEIIRLLPSLLRMGLPIACITSVENSRLAVSSKWCFTYKLPLGEGCPLNFAPMSSTTLQLVWGDLLASYRMAYTAFTLETFARLHPAGNIGTRLLRVADLMHRDPPCVSPDADLLAILQAMTGGRLGMTIVGEREGLVGVISDGDIRRAVEKAQRLGLNPLDWRADQIMTPSPICIPEDMLAVEGAGIMEGRKVTFLVVAEGASWKGVLHIHDLLAAKVL